MSCPQRYWIGNFTVSVPGVDDMHGMSGAQSGTATDTGILLAARGRDQSGFGLQAIITGSEGALTVEYPTSDFLNGGMQYFVVLVAGHQRGVIESAAVYVITCA